VDDAQSQLSKSVQYAMLALKTSSSYM